MLLLACNNLMQAQINEHGSRVKLPTLAPDRALCHTGDGGVPLPHFPFSPALLQQGMELLDVLCSFLVTIAIQWPKNWNAGGFHTRQSEMTIQEDCWGLMFSVYCSQ